MYTIISLLIVIFSGSPAPLFKTLCRTDWEATTFLRVLPSINTASSQQRGDSISRWGQGSAPRLPWDTVSPSFLPTTCGAVESLTISVTSLVTRPRRQGCTSYPRHLSFTTTALNNDLVIDTRFCSFAGTTEALRVDKIEDGD